MKRKFVKNVGGMKTGKGIERNKRADGLLLELTNHRICGKIIGQSV